MICVRYITERIEIEDKILRAEIAGKDHNYYEAYDVAIESEHRKRYLSETVDTLVNWLQHDVFEKAGSPLEERQYLYDFIVEEFIKLEEEHAHRIRAIRVALQNQRDQLLAFVGVIGENFSQLSKTHKIDIDIIWKMCELLRCKIGGDNYGIRSLPLQEALGDQYDEIEDSVIEVLMTTERTSCMAENLHSRIQPYALLRKSMSQNFLDLLRFYFNHTPFLRSEKSHRENKTPTEILFNKAHKHWLEMLGYKRVKRIKI